MRQVGGLLSQPRGTWRSIASPVRLDRGAGHGAVRAEHATIAWPRFERRSAPLAFIEDQARICRHSFGRVMAATRARQYRLDLGHGIPSARPRTRLKKREIRSFLSGCGGFRERAG